LKKIYSGENSYLRPDLKIATFTIFILASIFIIPSISQARLNCQSEIYLPATNNPKDKFKKGYCFIKLGQFQEGVTRLNGVENELPLVADYVIYYQAAGYENLRDYGNWFFAEYSMIFSIIVFSEGYSYDLPRRSI